MAFIHANNVYVTYNTVAQHEEEILQLLYEQTSKLNTIMATNQELQDALAQVQASLDAEQAQIAEMQASLEAAAAASAEVVAAQQIQIADLEAVIADLEAQIAAGATAEQLQAAVDTLSAIKSDIESTIPDAPSEPEA